jgi:hypothetical protein
MKLFGDTLSTRLSISWSNIINWLLLVNVWIWKLPVSWVEIGVLKALSIVININSPAPIAYWPLGIVILMTWPFETHGKFSISEYELCKEHWVLSVPYVTATSAGSVILNEPKTGKPLSNWPDIDSLVFDYPTRSGSQVTWVPEISPPI